MIDKLGLKKLRGLELTEKQARALVACAKPNSRVATSFWHDARARWYGPRRTLGSLDRRGLVSYANGGWEITKAGLELVAALGEIAAELDSW